MRQYEERWGSSRQGGLWENIGAGHLQEARGAAWCVLYTGIPEAAVHSSLDLDTEPVTYRTPGEQWHSQSPHLFLAVVASLLKARAHGQVCAVTKGARLGQIAVQAGGKWDLAQEGLALPGAVLSCHGLRLIASFSGTLRGAYSCTAHLTLGLSHRPVCGPSLLLALPFLRELEVLRAAQCFIPASPVLPGLSSPTRERSWPTKLAQSMWGEQP